MHSKIKVIRGENTSGGLGVNDTFRHNRLGECRVLRVNGSGSLTVVAVDVDGSVGRFRIYRSDDPRTWAHRVE